MKEITNFIDRHYRHFNAASLRDASISYKEHIEKGGKMLLAMAGAMSTAELGISLAEMIRQDKIHIISCSSNNLEEDIFNLVAHDFYKRVPNYRDLTPQDEQALLDQNLNRVTDTCIPEHEAMRRIEKHMLDIWIQANENFERYLPYEFFYKLIDSGHLEQYYQIDPKDSWVLAAREKNIPILTAGWEDSTLGNMFTAACIRGEIHPDTLKSGIELMIHFKDWYENTTMNSQHLNYTDKGVGFFQIGGGIAGDFPICLVPMMRQDLEMENTPLWSYFCQISDSTTSYGSYSGAVPNEKITWEKLGIDTPKFIVESDATIVAPLMFAYILGN